MRKYLAAVALIAALAQPASATTFPSLTTIYIGSGVADSGTADNTGSATVFNCTNVSGVNANLRFVILRPNGSVAGSATTTIAHGETRTAASHATAFFNELLVVSAGIVVREGGINIEATQSAVFCTAKVVDAAASVPSGFDLPLVRVNPHPGTVE
jgi:hypothetical protein